MAEVVIKPDPDRDEYVVWSTDLDAPAFAGTRAETAAELTSGRFGHYVYPQTPLIRADANGSSASLSWGFGHWPQEQFHSDLLDGPIPRDRLFTVARDLVAEYGEGL